MFRSRLLCVCISFIAFVTVAGASEGNRIAGGYTLGTGRTVPTVAAVLGLAGVIAGAVALVRPGLLRSGAPIALALGLISAAAGGLHAAYAAGGVGTGNGLAGAVVAVVLGLIGIILGALAMTRKRQTA